MEASALTRIVFVVRCDPLFKQLLYFPVRPSSAIDFGLLMTAITAASVALMICAELP
jgi:hypothetical protein